MIIRRLGKKWERHHKDCVCDQCEEKRKRTAHKWVPDPVADLRRHLARALLLEGEDGFRRALSSATLYGEPVDSSEAAVVTQYLPAIRAAIEGLEVAESAPPAQPSRVAEYCRHCACAACAARREPHAYIDDCPCAACMAYRRAYWRDQGRMAAAKRWGNGWGRFVKPEE